MIPPGRVPLRSRFMLINAGLLPTPWEGWFGFFYLVTLAYALGRLPYRRLQTANAQHLVLGTAVALGLAWAMHVEAAPGLGMHFLGVTVVTLMVGWPTAILVTGLATLVDCAFGLQPWSTVGVNALLFSVLPATLTIGIYRWSDQRLPNHLFIYIFICGFFGSALATGAALFAGVGLLHLAEVYDWDRIHQTYLPFVPLILFTEAFLNGLLVTVLVAVRPDWVWTFDDARYLYRR
jgi:uncharacterized membrane protein